MKKIIKLWFIYFVSLVIICEALPSLRIADGYLTLVKAAIALSFFDFLIKPIVKLLLLPINILTLGIFRWIINVLVLYLTTILVPHFQINPFLFPGFQSNGLVLPSFSLSLFWSYIFVSFLLDLISSIIRWLIK
jgi:putative membrane protein